MIEFLNALFEGDKIIADITYSSTEYNGESTKEKKEHELDRVFRSKNPETSGEYKLPQRPNIK